MEAAETVKVGKMRKKRRHFLRNTVITPVIKTIFGTPLCSDGVPVSPQNVFPSTAGVVNGFVKTAPAAASGLAVKVYILFYSVTTMPKFSSHVREAGMGPYQASAKEFTSNCCNGWGFV